MEVKSLEDQLQRMCAEIEHDSIEVTSEFASDISEIMGKNNENASPFMKLFWKQQKLAFVGKKVSQYHPMIIRFSLSLAAKPAAAYDELRDSKILTSPSRRTLRDHRNAIKPSVGFNKEVISELITTSEKLTTHQKYVTLAFDEMKVKENLVFDKNSNELIGYVDIGDPE